MTQEEWYRRKAGSKAYRQTLYPRQVDNMKMVEDLLAKADITSIVSGRVFSDILLWGLIPCVAENYATSLIKAKVYLV